MKMINDFKKLFTNKTTLQKVVFVVFVVGALAFLISTIKG